MGEYEDLLAKLRFLKKTSRVYGGMTPPPNMRVLLDAIEFADTNAGITGSHPELLEAHYYLVSQASTWLFNHVYPGLYTSGGTESNILAVLAARIEGRTRVVYPETAHYSIEKAVRLLGMKAVRVPVDSNLDPDPNTLADTVDADTLVVLTHGTTETGHVDDIPNAARIACDAGATVHVDAAYTGPFARHFQPHRTPVRLDECIQTITIDLHKLPQAPAPAGLLLAYNAELIEKLAWSPGYLPSPQPGLLGTRPGWALVAAALTLAWINDHGGPAAYAERLMQNTWTLYRILVEEGPYQPVHPPETPLFCMTHANMRQIIHTLEKTGYKLYTCPSHNGIRITITQPPDNTLLDHLLHLATQGKRQRYA